MSLSRRGLLGAGASASLLGGCATVDTGVAIRDPNQ